MFKHRKLTSLIDAITIREIITINRIQGVALDITL